MKIFLTGSSGKQCNLAKLHNRKIFDAQNMSTAMKTFADVDFALATKDANIEQYDYVVSGFGSIGSFNYPFVLQALYAVGKAKKPIVYLEDWRCPTAIAKGLRTCYEKGYDNFLKTVYNKTLSTGDRFYRNIEQSRIDPETVWLGIEKIIAHPEDCHFIFLGFNWGNKQIVADILRTKVENLLWFEETPYLIEQLNMQDIPYDGNRAKKFFYCGLTNQDRWLKKSGIFELTDCFGPSPYEKIPSESLVIKKHSEYLGIAIPEYEHAGSGWLRFRYTFGAMSKNVFYVCEKDANALGITSVKSFDDYSAAELEEIAMSTYKTIMKWTPTKEESHAQLKKQFEAIV